MTGSLALRAHTLLQIVTKGEGDVFDVIRCVLIASVAATLDMKPT